MNFWSWLTRRRADHGWPGYLINGRIRTSTVGLVVALFAIAWVHNTYAPPPPAPVVPDTAVVPPGFVPDPEYTWVPRTNVQERPKTTTTTPTTTETTPTTTTTTEPSPTSTSPTSPTTTTSTTAPPPVIDPDGPGPIPPQTLTPITIPSLVLPTLPGLGPAPTTPPPPR